jgi:hypothetical protein
MKHWVFAAGLFAICCFSLFLPEITLCNELSVPLQLDSSWNHENDSNDGIAVYSRQTEGSRVREIMAESRIEAPVDEILKVISDYGKYTEFMPYVEKCEVLAARNGETIVFQQLEFMPPISDRFYTIVLKQKPDPEREGGVQVLWHLATAAMLQKTGKGLGIPVNRGGWRLLPENQGTSTKIYYYLLTDPGGSIPGWVSNIANTSAVPKIIRAVRDRLQETLNN